MLEEQETRIVAREEKILDDARKKIELVTVIKESIKKSLKSMTG